MNLCTSENVDDIEDLLLPDSGDAHQNKKYVLQRAARHRTSTLQQTSADSIIPGM